MWVRRVHRQHSTCVMSVPKPVMQAMGAKPGDYVSLEETKKAGVFVFAKIHEGSYHDGRDNRDLSEHY